MILDLWSEQLREVEARNGFYFVPAKIELAVGVVLVVRDSADQVALVQKATKEAYEFSGLWTFPGGMVRGTSGSFLNALETSLQSRVAAETGLAFADVGPLPTHELWITSYHAKGSRRFVLVLPFTARAEGPLVPSDVSITSSRWFAPAELNAPMAPANLLILKQYLAWRGHPLPDAQVAGVTNAEQRCEEWRREAKD